MYRLYIILYFSRLNIYISCYYYYYYYNIVAMFICLRGERTLLGQTKSVRSAMKTETVYCFNDRYRTVSTMPT